MKLVRKIALVITTALIFPWIISNAEEPANAEQPVAANHPQEVKLNQTSIHFDDFDESDFKSYELASGNSADIEDPYEPFNRTIFSLNKGVDSLILNPVAHVYRGIVPVWGRDRVNSALANLREPVNLGNAILQGDPDKASRAFSRFLVNTLLGLGGLIDVATVAGIPAANEDFGRTLSSYGVETGPYLVLPIFGPSSVRDFPSLGADIAMDPYTWLVNANGSYIRAGVRLLSIKESLLDPSAKIQRTALDEYSYERSIYAQKRQPTTKPGNPS